MLVLHMTFGVFKYFCVLISQISSVERYSLINLIIVWAFHV